MNNKELIAIVVAVLVLGAAAFYYYFPQENKELKELSNKALKPEYRPQAPVVTTPFNLSQIYINYFDWEVAGNTLQTGEERLEEKLISRYAGILLQRQEKLSESKASELFGTYFSEPARGEWKCDNKDGFIFCASVWTEDGKKREAMVYNKDMIDEIAQPMPAPKNVTVIKLFVYE